MMCGEEKDLKLPLDVSTRWNSLHDMIARFVRVRPAIDSLHPDKLSEEEWLHLITIEQCLEPVKLCVEKLGAESCNLLMGRAAIDFMMEIIDEKESSTFARRLSAALTQRLGQRQSQVLDALTTCTNRKLRGRDSKGFNALLGLMNVERESHGNPSEEVNMEEPNEPSQKSTAQEFDERMAKASVVDDDVDSSTSSMNILKHEIAAFRATGIRPKTLANLYRQLCTVQATSVQSERAFSSAGQICTKIRSSLSDEMLCSLCLLRAFYEKH